MTSPVYEPPVGASYDLALALLDQMPIPVWRAGTDLRCTWMNKAWREFTGREPRNEADQGWAESIHPEDMESFLSACRTACDSKEPFQIEYRLRHHTGEFRWFSNRGVPFFDPGGSFAGFVSYCLAVTPGDAHAGGKPGQHLDSHMANSPVGIVEFDSDLRVTRWSASAMRIFGWGASEIVGKLVQEVHWVHPGDMDMVTETWDRMLSGQSPQTTTTNRNLRKDGSVIHCEWYNSAIYHPDGRLASVLSQVLDVTKRKQAEECLAYHESCQRTMVELSVNFAAATPDGLDRLVNESLARIGRLLGVDRSYVFLIDSEAGTMTNTQEWCAAGVSEEKPNLQNLPVTMFPEWMRAITDRQSIVVSRVSEMPDTWAAERAALEMQGIQSVFVAPLATATRLYGFAGFDFVRCSHSWGNDERQMLEIFASLLANTLERNFVQRALIASEERWRFAMEGAGDALWDVDIASGNTYYSAQWNKMLGYEPHEKVSWEEVVHPDDRQGAEELFQRHIQDQVESFSIEQRLCCKDGSYKWILSRGKVITRSPEGKPLRFLGTHSDLSRQRLMEHKLRESAEFLQLAAEVGRLGTFNFDYSANRGQWSPELLALFGLAPRMDLPLDSGNVPRFVHPQDHRLFMDAMRAANDPRGDGQIKILFRVVLPDASVRWLRVRGRVFFSGEGARRRRWRSIGTAIDVTELKEAQEHLARLSIAVEQSPVAVMITDLDGRIEYTNPQFSRQTGYSAEEVLGRNPRLLKSGQQPPEFYRELWNQIKAGHTWRGDMCNRRKDGELVWEYVAIAPIRGAHDDLTGFVALREDVTLKRSAEVEMARALERQREARETMSRFVAMTSHEFRTPMTAIQLNMDMLADSINEGDRTRSHRLLERMHSAMSRLRQMLDEIITVNRSEQGKISYHPQQLDLRALAQNVVDEFQQAEGRQHLFEIKPGAGAFYVQGDPDLLWIVLTNLVGNAVRYSAPGTTICLELACGQGAVDLSIRDQGIGIPEHDMKRIFEAFERGSNVGNTHGTGLGLNIVKRLVELHSGTIDCTSREDCGTTFRIRLAPAVES
jgi:PAS domain S-box-containing protein